MTRPSEINPQHLVSQFLTTFQTSGVYLREPIEKLAELASSENPETVEVATEAVFASLVEHLADSFEPQAVLLYNRLFAQLIQFCRQTSQGKALDETLAKFGLQTESDLITRAEQLRYVRKFASDEEAKKRIKLAIILSRVTIGADVAITSPIIERLKRDFPSADIVLIGNSKAAQLFGGDERLGFSDIKYKRAGTLTERLLSWLEVWRSVAALLNGLGRDEFLIVDPDSRLTQLGLLPLSRAEKLDANPPRKTPIIDDYLFFPSRELGHRTSHSLGQLTSLWLNAVFGGNQQTYPALHLKRQDLEYGNTLVKGLRNQDWRPIVAINFGVGENPMKRVSDAFEKQVVVNLLQGGAKIILDKGAGTDELQRADRVIAEVGRVTYDNRNLKVSEFDEEKLASFTIADSLDADMLVWRGRIGLLASLIGKSDLYIGYDSAGQHIAAAMGVPCVDVFAGFTSRRMLERWKPEGKAASRIIAVDTLNNPVDSQAVLSDVLTAANQLLKNQMILKST
jgi:ADP-heptose:LPS heptosyltransferase